MFELNGYQLPDFPVSGFPYAMISFDSSGGCAYLTFVDKVGYIKKNIIDNVWYGNAYTLGLTADMAHDESKVIYEESYVVMLDEAYKDALELLYPGINKTSWLRYTPSSKQTPSGGYYALAMNYGPQWANFTLYDEGGNLFLSAGRKFPLRGWLGWLLPGLCSRSVPVVEKREPVAYLYNGICLPGLPERDKTTHPCALVLRYGTTYSSTETTILYFMEKVSDRRVTVSDYTGENIEEYIYYHPGDIQYRVEHEKGKTFTSWGEPTVLDEQKMVGVNNVLWTNTDLILQFTSNNTGLAGELFLAASDPIPVYE